jgi:hypothetical protein
MDNKRNKNPEIKEYHEITTKYNNSQQISSIQHLASSIQYPTSSIKNATAEAMAPKNK